MERTLNEIKKQLNARNIRQALKETKQLQKQLEKLIENIYTYFDKP